MTLDELSEAIEELLTSGFQIETDKHGQVVIFTGLRQDEDGELFSLDDDDDDFDPDMTSLDDEDDDEE